ncbi:hypothetical protein [Bryobacter aggregatus]|uniref:hypothetical protein n=1 Tax=Bryobacter aggregatus TaxID=360054 RepID=UPI0004E16ED4|nr:hypothetical protein [Bryobacter aggregatus]
MFGRGNWAIVGLVKESLEDFSINLADPVRMAAASQLAAAAVASLYGGDATGINPYDAPRLDEKQELNLDQQTELARYAVAEQVDGTATPLPEEILAGSGYGRTVAAFQIHSQLPWFGLWAVYNEQKNASDLPSMKEQRSYVMLERPYKFLQPTDKRTVDDQTLDATAVSRTQVPVLLDFHLGRVYIESTNSKQIYSVIVSLNRLGAQIVPVAWNYPAHNWTEAILNRLYEGTQFRDEFKKRAEEAMRFKEKEIEKLEDREMEAIVSKFFSMTELSSGIWAGISGPSRIRIHDAAPPIAVSSPTMATTLLNLTEAAGVVTGAITMQESITITTKSGAERNIRRDIARFDLNDRINLTDVGAAMLRGFDMASHKKDVLREIRETRQVPAIPQFWGGWLHQMNNAVHTIEESFREVLELGGDEQGGIVPMQISGAAENAPTP